MLFQRNSMLMNVYNNYINKDKKSLKKIQKFHGIQQNHQLFQPYWMKVLMFVQQDKMLLLDYFSIEIQ